MNKGLFYHIIISIIYVLCVLYITNGIDTDWNVRFIIVIGLGVSNFFTLMFLDSTNAYKEKI
jgi:hypothetical protein